MQMSNESNGHGKFEPEVYYEYLDADVWYEHTFGKITIVYTEDLLAELYGEDDSEDSTQDNSNN